MRDKRPVDELTIEELERVLAIRKREERQKQLERMKRSGRVVAEQPASPVGLPLAAPPSAGGARPPASKPAASGHTGAAPRFEDDPDIERPSKADDDRFWKSFVNQALMLVEVAAVAGLIFLGYQLFIGVNTLQEETANAQALADEQRRAGIPTLEPTPQLQLSQVVLPGGHTPPTAPGGARFNFEEIPSNLWPLVESQVMQPISYRPPPTDETALVLNIPKLRIDQTIVQGVDWEALKLGVGQLVNGTDPADDQGNLVLSAHNDIYGEYFRHLDQLEPGDEFYVRTRTKVYTYRVIGHEIVKPTDVHVLEPRGGATATLISCYPYQVNTQRIVVFAERVGESF